MKFYAIEEADLARLKRDAGHTITSVVRAIEALGEIPEEKST